MSGDEINEIREGCNGVCDAALDRIQQLERELAEKTEELRKAMQCLDSYKDELNSHSRDIIKVGAQRNTLLSLVRRLVAHYDKRNAEMNGFKSPLTSMDEWMEEERSLEQEARKIVEGMK